MQNDVEKMTGEVRLRPLEERDISAVFALRFEEEGAALAGVEGEFLPEEQFHAAMKAQITADPTSATVHVILVGGEFAGYVGVFKLPKGGWQVSYWIARPFWRKGVGSRAVRDLLNSLPVQVVGQPLFAAVIEGNQASLRILECNGFKRYGSRSFHSAAHGEERQQILLRRAATT